MKKIGIIAGAVVIIAGVVLTLFLSKSNKNESFAVDSKFNRYISAFTSGVVSKDADIKIRFNTPIVDEEACGPDLPINDKILVVSPSIKGKLYWLDQYTLILKPENLLESGKEYECELKLNELMEVEKGFELFEFKFTTIQQNFIASVKEIETTDKSKLIYQKVTVELTFADIENIENVKKLVYASYNDQQIPIEITSTTNKSFIIEIDSVERKEQKQVLYIELNGENIGIEHKEKLEVDIAALGDYKLQEAKVVYSPSVHVVLQFTDPLDENQNLSGLIRIGNSHITNYTIESNIIKVYPNSILSGNHKLSIDKGVKNVLGYKLKEDIELSLEFQKIKPAIRLVNKGTILPAKADGLLFPFEAVNIKAVDVRIVKIYANNITQFLQVNDFDGLLQLKRVGKTILKKNVPLQNVKADLGTWNRFYLDLNDLIDVEEGAMYNISLGFRKKHSLYNCDESSSESLAGLDDDSDIDESWMILSSDYEPSYWDYYNGVPYWEYWDNQDNPCHDAYYGSKLSVSQNLFVTNLGVVAKKADNGKMYVFVNDMQTAMPVDGAEVSILDFQKQVLATSITNSEGKSEFKESNDAYFIMAKNGFEKAYLKLTPGSALSLSMFEVSGSKIQKGLKGYIFGERGVWRPGDSLYLSFILEDKAKTLPEGHPINFELYNVKRQKVYETIVSKNDNDFYVFRMKTNEDDATGDWMAKVNVGGAEFTKIVKVETVKPNRLKINLDFGKEFLTKSDGIKTKLSSTWLHGAIAKNLKSKVDVSITSASTYFEQFKDFTFNNPTADQFSHYENVFEGRLNEKGEVDINYTFPKKTPVGLANATFTTKVFEESGEFSIDKYSIKYYPHDIYLGVKLPKGDESRGMLLTDTSHTAKVVLVDAKGNLVKNDVKLNFTLYKVEWRWWWDNSSGNSSNYSSSSYKEVISSGSVLAKSGKAEWDFRVEYPDWGRYLIEVSSPSTGHSCASYTYIDWPGWAGRAQREGAGEGAAMLPFSTDKKKYEVGEDVIVSIPVSKEGRALVTIESGSDVVESFWVQSANGETQFKFSATDKMVPNVYVSVMMVQPHSNTTNDLPIRMYGIKPITVTNPYTELKPKLEMPDELRADSKVVVKVSEENQRPMTYVIAMVDEGLLDLTRFKTPDPWSTFYAKESLGITTWDYYDDVIGAYENKIDRLLNIGGGGEFEDEEKKSAKANRFKPMVKFIGPFNLRSGENVHEIQLPRYIGSVRTMVIARDAESYGATEKTTPVKKPLMVLGTLPRVLTPGDSLNMPVTLFCMDKNLKNATVSVSSNGYVTFLETNMQAKLVGEGETTISFPLTVPDKLGVAKITINAKSGNETASYDFEIDVRTPNPEITESQFISLQDGESKEITVDFFGMSGTNELSLEFSSIPAINMDKRLRYLIKYPHGCVEQTTSGAFPQLYLKNIVEMSDQMKLRISNNIKGGIARLQNFQNASGGFSYWPGIDVNDWSTCYAGHFLVEAKSAGYNVPNDILNKWVNYQKSASRNWSSSNDEYEHRIQAYRLYTLALSGNPDLGSMNRMKEISNLDIQTLWRLAQAYSLAGKNVIAKEIVAGLPEIEEKPQNYYSYTYGSYLRDKAIILEACVQIGLKDQSLRLMKEIAESLNSTSWYSTQTTSYSLMAIAKYAGSNSTGSGLNATYSFHEETKNIQSSKNIAVVNLSSTKNGNLKLTNNGKGALFVNVVRKGVPSNTILDEKEKNISISVEYYTMDGKLMDYSSIEQGTDFVAQVSIRNIGTNGSYQNLAVEQLFPSGWEIVNDRLFGGNSNFTTSSFDYRDYRDDRVYTYCSLYTNGTKRFSVMLNAAYEGSYYLPVAKVEEMYDNTIFANTKSQRIKVIKAK